MILTAFTFYFKLFCFFLAVHNNVGALDCLLDFLTMKTMSILWLLCPWADNYNLIALNLFLLLIKLKCSMATFLKVLTISKYIISSHFEKEVIFHYLVQYDKISVYNANVEKFYNIPTNNKNQPEFLELYFIDYLKIKYIGPETTDNLKFLNDLKVSIETPIEENNFNKKLRIATIIIFSLFYIECVATMYFKKF